MCCFCLSGLGWAGLVWLPSWAESIVFSTSFKIIRVLHDASPTPSPAALNNVLIAINLINEWKIWIWKVAVWRCDSCQPLKKTSYLLYIWKLKDSQSGKEQAKKNWVCNENKIELPFDVFFFLSFSFSVYHFYRRRATTTSQIPKKYLSSLDWLTLNDHPFQATIRYHLTVLIFLIDKMILISHGLKKNIYPAVSSIPSSPLRWSSYGHGKYVCSTEQSAPSPYSIQFIS